MPSEIYRVPHPYVNAELQNIQFVQSKNVLYIASTDIRFINNVIQAGFSPNSPAPEFSASCWKFGAWYTSLGISLTHPYWLVGTTYAINDVAVYNGVTYESLGNGNTGHVPPSSPLNWIEETTPGHAAPGTFLSLGTLGGNVAYDGERVELSIGPPPPPPVPGDQPVPGVNGFPNGPSFSLEYYLVTTIRQP